MLFDAALAVTSRKNDGLRLLAIDFFYYRTHFASAHIAARLIFFEGVGIGGCR